MILNYTDTGSGTPIVLLHGMAGSIRYWNNFVPYIQKGHRIIAIDLLGFGHSPMPKNTTYTYETHIKSIMDTLQHIGVEKPFNLIGHSMGALIALRLAARHAAQIEQLILIAMPLYTSSEQAHKALTKSSKLKEWAYYGTSSKILCTVWCYCLRPISSRLAPKYLTHLTAEAAKDSVLHTWKSYSESLHNIIEHQHISHDMHSFNKPVTLVYGEGDMPKEISSLKSYSEKYKLMLLPGTHQVINECPQKIADLLT
jgi:cis-3-alkyl-4-acyloxetan-2-one decarboxylase